jgi:enhancing lycopene biosynthesis protein 2
MKKIALILAGCGQQDGSEIQETVLTLLALAQENLSWDAFAPDILQTHVSNHLTKQPMPGEQRNVLTEAARLVRGKINQLTSAKINDYAGVIIPGGLGVVTNLCDYFTKGIDFTLQADVANFLQATAKAKLPTVFICIAPVMIPKIYPNKPKMTLGNDPKLAQQMTTLGAIHIACAADDIVLDETNKIISTPANMVAKNIQEVYQGIHKAIIAQKKLMAI